MEARSTSLRVTALLMSVAGIGVIGVGVWAASGYRSDPSEFAGLDLLLGGVACGLGLVIVVLAGLVYLLARRNPRAASVLLICFGVVAALIGWQYLGGFPFFVFGPFLIGGLIVGLVGFGALTSSADGCVDGSGRNR